MKVSRIIQDCPNAACLEPLYRGSCKQECWDRYNSRFVPAKWKHRGAHNDFLWAECSNCGFRVENYKAVKTGRSDTDYVDVKYKFCPMCGKPMEV